VSLRVVRVAVPGYGGGDSGGGRGGCQRWRWREFVRCRCGGRGRCCRRDSHDPIPFWEGREVGPWDGGSIPLKTSACTAPTASPRTIPASVVLVVLDEYGSRIGFSSEGMAIMAGMRDAPVARDAHSCRDNADAAC